jgi:hypothetical protein
MHLSSLSAGSSLKIHQSANSVATKQPFLRQTDELVKIPLALLNFLKSVHEISLVIVVGKGGVPAHLNLIVPQSGVDFGGDNELLLLGHGVPHTRRIALCQTGVKKFVLPDFLGVS